MTNGKIVALALLGLIGTASAISWAADFGFGAFMVALLGALVFWGWLGQP